MYSTIIETPPQMWIRSNRDPEKLPPERLSQLGLIPAYIPISDRPLIRNAFCHTLEDERLETFSEVPYLQPEQARAYYDTVYVDMLRSWIARGSDPRELFIGNPEECTILDLGCGQGQITASLIDNNRVYGVDIAESLLIEADQRGINPVLADANIGLPFPDEIFDMVYSFDVFEHLFNIHDALSEINRVMKVGGIVRMTVPIMQAHTMDDNMEFHASTVEQLGITDDLSTLEPEVNIKGFFKWVDLMYRHGFNAISRAYGYEWGADEESQYQYLAGPPYKAPNAFFLLQKVERPLYRHISARIAAGALSFEEIGLLGMRLAPSDLLIEFLSNQSK